MNYLAGGAWGPESGRWAGSPPAGPAPDSVAAAAQRLSGLARELDALRLRLGNVAYLDWTSTAAVAFRESLSELVMDLAGAAQAAEAASTAVGGYGMAIRDMLSAEACLSPLAEQQAAGTRASYSGWAGYSGAPAWPNGGLGTGMWRR